MLYGNKIEWKKNEIFIRLNAINSISHKNNNAIPLTYSFLKPNKQRQKPLNRIP